MLLLQAITDVFKGVVGTQACADLNPRSPRSFRPSLLQEELVLLLTTIQVANMDVSGHLLSSEPFWIAGSP